MSPKTNIKINKYKYVRPVAYAGMAALTFSIAGLAFLISLGQSSKQASTGLLIDSSATQSVGSNMLSENQWLLLAAIFILLAIALTTVFYMFGRFRSLSDQLLSRQPVLVNKGKTIVHLKADPLTFASHQLKTPLTSVKWLSEMLLNGDAGNLNTRQKEMLEQIEQSTVRAFDLVGTYLGNAENRKLHFKHVKINDLICDVLKELEPEIEGKKLNVEMNIKYNTPVVNVDPKVLKECFVGILSNAVKYSENNGNIGVEIMDKGHDVIARIEDSGCGIPKSEQDKVFNKFFRASNARALEPEGHGLGMYLVKEMASSMGGKVWFSSEQNKGTTVWLSVPKINHHHVSK